MRIEVRPKDPKISQIQSSTMISSVSTHRKSPFEGSGGCLGSHSSHQNRSYQGKKETVAHQMFLALRGSVFLSHKIKNTLDQVVLSSLFWFLPWEATEGWQRLTPEVSRVGNCWSLELCSQKQCGKIAMCCIAGVKGEWYFCWTSLIYGFHPKKTDLTTKGRDDELFRHILFMALLLWQIYEFIDWWVMIRLSIWLDQNLSQASGSRSIPMGPLLLNNLHTKKMK